MRTQILVGVLLIIVTGIFAKYKIFDDKIELKYSLSEKISSEFTDKADDFGIQQLTIKNSGKTLVSSIVIKIKENVQDIKIIRFKSTDLTSIKNDINSSEILYPEIPPLGEIIILLKIKGNSIHKNNLEIFHSQGVAREAFTNDTSYLSIFFITLIIINSFLVLYNTKELLISSLENRSKSNALGILKRNKPCYLNDSDWAIIRDKAISLYLENDGFSTIEKSLSFQLLHSEKKEYLTSDEWQRLKEKAEKKLDQIVEKKMNSHFYESSIKELSNLQKPQNMSENSWKSIQENISRIFCSYKMRDTIRYKDYPSVINILKSKTPNIATEDDWLNLKKVLSSFYLSYYIEDTLNSIHYKKTIDKTNFDILEISRKKEITSLLEKINEGYILRDYYTEILETIQRMYYWSEIPTKPETIKPNDWTMIEKLYDKFIAVNNNATLKLSEADFIKSEFFPLKEIITNQLAIIDNLIKDPHSVNNVEDYNNPFAIGNWQNILKISKIMINEGNGKPN